MNEILRGGGVKVNKTHIIEVLTGFHYVWRPLHLIYLHPTLAQELSEGAQTHVMSSTIINTKIPQSK